MFTIENHALLGHHTLVALLSWDDRYTVHVIAVSPTPGQTMEQLIMASQADTRYHEPWGKHQFVDAVLDFAKRVSCELMDEVSDMAKLHTSEG